VRISDERYSRDLRRIELARRMLALQARTRTVARWTGMTMSRIRAMYHAYDVVDTPRRVPRRGITPFCVNLFWKSAVVRCEAAILAGFLRQFQVWTEETGDAAVDRLPSLTRGERLCGALEEFRGLRPDSELTLEHGMTLLTQLVRGVEIELLRCPQCEGLMLRDRLTVGKILCAFCTYEQQAGMAYLAAPKKRVAEPESGEKQQEESEGRQLSFF